MAKAANYFISAVWKNSEKVITHVFLHVVNDKNIFERGVKTPEAEVIKLIKANSIVMTLWWDYKKPGYEFGKRVKVVKEGTTEYLRTDKDNTVVDNLDNLLSGNLVSV